MGKSYSIAIFHCESCSLTYQSQVVVDPTINPQYMEMYADEEARGGVLEPEGIVGIKFRKERQLEIMARLDPLYGELKAKSALPNLSLEQQTEIKKQMTARENLLLPVYAQISLQYADLHDRAGRMKAKDTIRMPLVWKNARRFFYWRFRRRLNEEYILKRMAASSPKDLSSSPSSSPTSLSAGELRTIRKGYLGKLAAWSGIADFDTEDQKVAIWYEENREEVRVKIEAIKTESVAYDVASLLRGSKEGGLKGVKQVLGMLPVAEREEVLKYLAQP